MKILIADFLPFKTQYLFVFYAKKKYFPQNIIKYRIVN